MYRSRARLASAKHFTLYAVDTRGIPCLNQITGYLDMLFLQLSLTVFFHGLCHLTAFRRTPSRHASVLTSVLTVILTPHSHRALSPHNSMVYLLPAISLLLPIAISKSARSIVRLFNRRIMKVVADQLQFEFSNNNKSVQYTDRQTDRQKDRETQRETADKHRALYHMIPSRSQRTRSRLALKLLVAHLLLLLLS